jgi:capsular polysaccharide transport system permease protein
LSANLRAVRSPAAITIAVWRALFLREALTRIVSRRAAWFWLIAEPCFHIGYLMVLYTVVRIRTIGGIDTAVWIMVGLLAFLMFQRTGSQVSSAIESNQALFAYRQVKPIDTVLVRGMLEAFVMIISFTVLLCCAGMCGYNVVPVDPLGVMVALTGLWLLGMGWGLITSVAVALVPELGKVLKIVMRPLYFISGVLHPIAAVPLPYRDWLLFNPIVHGLEAARLGFAPTYHAVEEMSVSYLYGCALVSVFFGLSLHRHFAVRLVTR